MAATPPLLIVKLQIYFFQSDKLGQVDTKCFAQGPDITIVIRFELVTLVLLKHWT